MKLIEIIDQEYKTVSEIAVEEIKTKVKESKNIELMYKIAKEYFIYEANWRSRTDEIDGGTQKKDYDKLYQTIFHHWKYAPSPAEENTYSPQLLSNDNYYRKEHTTDEKLYTPEEITSFCILAENLQSDIKFHMFGNVLSALVKYHQNRTKYTNEYTIITNHLQRDLCYLGYENTSNIRVMGNVGANPFMKMKSGNVYIEGDAQRNFAEKISGGNLILNGTVQGNVGRTQTGGTITIKKDVLGSGGGNMKRGTLIIKGSVKEDVADFMHGGIIKIYGPVNGIIGSYMEHGSIYLYDTYGSISTNFENGKIYQHDKVIWSEWRKLSGFFKKFFP